MSIQKFLTEKNFQLYIFINVISYGLTFWLFPSFLTFVFLSVWTLFSIVVYWLLILNVPINFITVVLLFSIKSIQKKQYLTELTSTLCTSTNIIIGLLCFFCILFLFLFFKKTEVYNKISSFNEELNHGEKVVSNHLKEDVTFFGATREQLICSFLLLNGCCFCNEITALDLFVSDTEDVRLLTFTYAFFFTFTLIYTFILEIIIIFRFNHPADHPLFLAGRRFYKIAIAGAVQAYTFDRVCLSGDWDPPTSFRFVQDYQFSKLGCIATTKHSLKALTEYKDLGIKEAIPLIKDTKHLDVGILNDRIETKKMLLQELSEQKRKALKAATSHYDISLSGSQNIKKFDLLAPPLDCPPGESPEDVKYNYDHIDRVVARFHAERESESKKK